MISRLAIRILKTAGKLAVTAGVLIFIVWKLGWESIAGTIASARVDWLVYAFVLFLASCWLGAVQWQILLKNRGVRIPFSRAFSLYFVGMFFNNFALGTVTGDAVRIAYLKMNSPSGKPAFAATFLDRFAGLWAMLGFAVVGSALLIKQKALETRSMTLAVIALAVTFLLFGGIMAFLVSRRLQRRMHSLIDALPLPRKDFIRQVVDQTVLESRDFHVILPVALISTLVQFARVIVHIMCGAALALPISGANIHYFFIFVPMLAMFMIIPMPFGIREGAGGTLFALAGFQVHPAMVMGFLASLVGIAASLLGGLLFVVQRGSMKPDAPSAISSEAQP